MLHKILQNRQTFIESASFFKDSNRNSGSDLNTNFSSINEEMFIIHKGFVPRVFLLFFNVGCYVFPASLFAQSTWKC